MKDFVETRIIGAVRKLLAGRVNEILSEVEFAVPVIEFGNFVGGFVVAPVIILSGCERTEKERIILLDSYLITITLSFPETKEAELYCYAFASVISKAVEENPTLGGVAERAIITAKKYSKPKKFHSGEDFEVVLSLKITVEGKK